MVDPRPLPEPVDAATLVLARYLAAFGPASKRDVAAWAGVAQRDFAEAWERLETVSHRDENGTELLDLPGQPLPPAPRPCRCASSRAGTRSLLAYADRDRIIPPELGPLRLTLSGDQTVTVDGRVAASWRLERATRRVKVVIEPHVEIRRRRTRRSAPRPSARRASRSQRRRDSRSPGSNGSRLCSIR